ncbi:MAG: hypothetical protein ACREQY_17950, partial [Candidatus Binatia bacterium]
VLHDVFVELRFAAAPPLRIRAPHARWSTRHDAIAFRDATIERSGHSRTVPMLRWRWSDLGRLDTERPAPVQPRKTKEEDS